MRFAPLFLALALCSTIASARTWHVDASGAGDVPTIGAGIDSAATGDTVLVSCGTYHERDLAMKSGVCLRSETGLADCVTIDADSLGRVLRLAGATSPTTLEGLTFTGGYTTDDGGGASIVSNTAHVEVRDCAFVANACSLSLGGGLSIYGCSSVSVTRCLFEGNRASIHLHQGWGGGLSSTDSDPTITECVFRANDAYYGAGFYSWQERPLVNGCVFTGNTARVGAGVSCYDNYFGSSFGDCVFDDNTALSGGGAIESAHGDLAVSRTTFAGNSAGDDALGAAVEITQADVVLEQCIVAFSPLGVPVRCGTFATVDLSCCDLYGNHGGDYVGCLSPYLGVQGNFSADPLFCDAGAGDYGLRGLSPCADDGACGLVGALPVSCGALRVCADGSGDYTVIQDAIDAAQNGDVVLLCDGVYTGAGNRDLDFGGRAITLRSESGEPSLCVVDAEGAPGAAHRGFLFHGGEDTTASVEGITITGGYAADGGGVSINGASPRFVNCVIRDNDVHGNYGSRGGGVICLFSSPVFRRCVLAGNSATGSGIFLGVGGGLYCDQSSPLLENCTFYANRADGYGGAVMSQDASPEIVNSILAFSAQGGGFACSGASTPSMACCDLFGNVGGNWVCAAGSDTMNQSFSEDPLFCDAAAGDFSLAPGSPCLAAAGCGLVGALGEGCGSVTAVAGAGAFPPPPCELGANVPNPFNPSTALSFTLPGPARATLTIVDVRGREVASLADGAFQAGTFARTWDGRDRSGREVPSGVYFARLRAGSFTATRKMSLVR